jgi:hypothetical protein
LAKKRFWKNKRGLNKKKGKGAGKFPIGKFVRNGIYLLAALAIMFLGIWISSSYNDISELEFEDNFSEGFSADVLETPYREKEIFTLFIVCDWEEASRPQARAVTVMQIDRNAAEIKLISLHPDMYFRPYEYGELVANRHENSLVRIRDLMVVGELQSPPVPVAYSFYQIQELLAIRFDGYLYVGKSQLEVLDRLSGEKLPKVALESSSSYEEWAGELNDYWLRVFNSISFIGVVSNRGHLSKLETSMDVQDFYFFLSDFKDVEQDSIHTVEIKEDSIAEVINEQGNTVDLVTQGAVDDALKDFVGDMKIDREQARMEIFNGSGINGLGSRYGRWIGHLGIDVIRVGTAPGNQEQTVIYVTDKEEFSYTLSKIERLWEGEIKVVEGRPEFLTTGDVILVLGMDF